MKRPKIKLIILFSLVLMIFNYLATNIVADTTIGDTTIGVNEGDHLTYKITKVNETGTSYNVGDKLQYYIESIDYTNTTFTIHIQIYFYNSTSSNWEDYFLSSYDILEYDYISKNIISTSASLPLILPIPLNLTEYEEYFKDDPSVDTVLVGTDWINISSSIFDASVYFKFNEKGISKSITMYKEGYLMRKYVLEGGETSIPFGMMFLVFGTIGTIALVLLVKKRRTLVK